jgi:hypothetical protein
MILHTLLLPCGCTLSVGTRRGFHTKELFLVALVTTNKPTLTFPLYIITIPQWLTASRLHSVDDGCVMNKSSSAARSNTLQTMEYFSFFKIV